jgi:hypothetical protein
MTKLLLAIVVTSFLCVDRNGGNGALRAARAGGGDAAFAEECTEWLQNSCSTAGSIVH